MKIALLPNLTRENALKVSKDILNELDKLNAEYYIESAFKQYFNGFKANYLSEEDCIKSSDVVIAVGGDGTILSSAKKCAQFNKPILGVNAGRVAFMAGLEPTELEKLKCLIENDFSIDKRMMLEVIYGDDNLSKLCINDAFVGRARHINMAELEIRCDDNLINNYFADGVIVSTPTGSTAYSLSAGGPVIDPLIESLMLTPVCNHSLFSRSIIFKKESTLEIINRNRDNDDVYLSCDGEESIIIPVNSNVIIKKAEKSAEFIRIKNESFVDILNSKLSQKRS